MLQNRIDIFPLLTFVGIVLFRMLMWYLEPEVYFLWLILITGLIFILYCIKHNQMHQAIFKSKMLNNFFDSLMGLFTGTSSYGAYIVHVINHHHEENGEDDWGNTEIHQNRFEIINLINYAFSTPIIFFRRKNHWMQTNKLKSTERKSIIESTKIILFYITLTLLKPSATFYFIILPNITIQLVLVSFNFFQHRGCLSQSKYNHSRNFTGKILNSFTFNNGYHTVHHLFPNAHWTEYPQLQCQFKAKINPEFNESNLFTYFLISILFKQNRPESKSQIINE